MKPAWITFVVCLVLFFVGLGARPLWDIDEGMHAVTSVEMIESGDWVVPTLNGVPFQDKPALHNWFVAVAFLLFGFTEFAARLPAALLGLGCVMITYRIGSRLFNPRTGMLAALALATCGLHLTLSRSVVHDISLSFFVCAALMFFQAAFADERHRTRDMLLCYLACGFGVLAKGPLGAVLPGLTILGFLIARRRLGFLKHMQLPLGLLIVPAVSAPWYILMSAGDPGYAFYFFVQKNVQGFVEGSSGHSEPFHYYLSEALWVAFLPWSLLIPLVLVRAFRARAGEFAEGIVFALSWFLSGLAFFSLASAKLGTYLLPVLPGLALLTGHVFERQIAAAGAGRRAGWLVPQILLALVFASALGVALASDSVRADLVFNGLAPDGLAGLVGLLLALALGGALAIAARHTGAAFAALAAITPAALFYFLVVLAPGVNRFRSMKDLTFAMEPILAPGQAIVFYKRLKDSALFYTEREVRTIREADEIRAHLGADERVFLFVDRRKMDELETLDLGAHVVAEDGEVFVLSNRAGVLTLDGI